MSLNVLFVAVAASRSVVIVRPARRGQQQGAVGEHAHDRDGALGGGDELEAGEGGERAPQALAGREQARALDAAGGGADPAEGALGDPGWSRVRLYRAG